MAAAMCSCTDCFAVSLAVEFCRHVPYRKSAAAFLRASLRLCTYTARARFPPSACPSHAAIVAGLAPR